MNVQFMAPPWSFSTTQFKTMFIWRPQVFLSPRCPSSADHNKINQNKIGKKKLVHGLKPVPHIWFNCLQRKTVHLYLTPGLHNFSQGGKGLRQMASPKDNNCPAAVLPSSGFLRPRAVDLLEEKKSVFYGLLFLVEFPMTLFSHRFSSASF